MSYRENKYPQTWNSFYDFCERYETFNDLPLSEKRHAKNNFLAESNDFLAVSLGDYKSDKTSEALRDFMLNPSNDIVKQKLLNHIYNVLDYNIDADMYATFESCSDENVDSVSKKLGAEWKQEVRSSVR